MQTNLNMQISLMVFILADLDQKNLFLGQFSPKNQYCQFQLNFFTRTNSNMLKSLVMFTFSVFTWKYLVGQICLKKIIDQFKLKFGMQTDLNVQNLMVVFIVFLFRLEIPFSARFGPGNENCQFKLKFGTKTNWNIQDSVVRAVHFFCF